MQQSLKRPGDLAGAQQPGAQGDLVRSFIASDEGDLYGERPLVYPSTDIYNSAK